MGYYLEKNTGLIFKDRERFLIFMDPVLYLEKQKDMLKHLSPRFVLNLFQNAFSELLNCFLSEKSLSIKDRLISPFSGSGSNEIKNSIAKIAKISYIARKAEIPLGNYRNFISEDERMPDSKYISRLIYSLYMDYDELIKNYGDEIIKKYSIKNTLFFDKNLYKQEDENYFNPIINFYFKSDNLMPNLTVLFLFGSFSNLNYVKGFSDANIMGAIKSEVLFDPDRIENLRRIFLKHYRFLNDMNSSTANYIVLLTENDLNYFSRAIFSLNLFKFSSSLFEYPNIFDVFERDSSLERVNKLWNICYYFRKEFLSARLINDLNEYAVFIKKVLILPFIYYQAKGRFFSPSDSLDYFKREHSEFSGLIDEIQRLRHNWNFVKKPKSYRRNKNVKKILYANPFLYPFMKRKINLLTNKQKSDYGKYLKRIFKLTESIIKEIPSFYTNKSYL